MDNCPPGCLDAVFAECYGRWAGRRSLLVPGTPEGIDQRYDEWLWYFDPDIIYSFVPLTENAVAAVHERFGPAFLKLHKEPRPQKGPPRFTIDLPVTGLSSLSVLPVYATRSRGLPNQVSKIQVLDKVWDNSSAPFVEENFGFLARSLGNDAYSARQHPSLFTCATLISKESFENSRNAKDANADYLMDEDSVLDRLGATGGPITIAQLAEFFAPCLFNGHNFAQGLTLVAGDTPADRLVFWNQHHHHESSQFGVITGLRLPADRLSDGEFLARIRRVIARRGAFDHQGRTDTVTLRSTSLGVDVLEEVAEKLRKAGDPLHVRIVKDEDHANCILKFRNPDTVRFTRGGIFGEPEGRATTEFQGDRLVIPRAVPWHISEALLPPVVRRGNWMVDVEIDRLEDHCGYVNMRHVWALPRRIRIERAFELERESHDRHDHYGKFIRPSRRGLVAIALNVDVTRAAIRIPEDLDAIRLGICNHYEWSPFDGFRENAPCGRTRFQHAALSDKGRYLIGVLQLFDSLPDAFGVLMHGYWRDVLKHLGAVPLQEDPTLRENFLAALRKRLHQYEGPIKVETSGEMEKLSRVALHFGRMAKNESRYVDYAWLKKEWLKLLENELVAIPPNGDDDEVYWRDEKRLNHSIQYACQSEVLFQGLEWRCRICFNRNWVGIEALGQTLDCEVCGRSEAAPVSGDWHFRPNSFLMEAYRQHGTEVLIWALWKLWKGANRSFYFAPSLQLWRHYPKNKEQCDVEIDALAVVDGRVHIVEATTEVGLTDAEVNKLALAAENIRPDVLFFACGTAGNTAQIAARLKSAIPAATEISVMAFDPKQLERRPWLHS